MFENEKKEIFEHLVTINRVAKVVKGGRRFGFAAIMIVGDSNGRVGYGTGKAKEVPEAVRKATENAKNKNRKDLAEKLGKEIAKRSIKNGVKEVAFDKGKYKYHGIIKILADAARAGGLDF